MKVRAKVVCTKNEQIGAEQHLVAFSAVIADIGGSDENKSFSRWTPVLNLSMCISDESQAGSLFEQGKEYYLTFDKA
jgi:hypothetical protein